MLLHEELTRSGTLSGAQSCSTVLRYLTFPEASALAYLIFLSNSIQVYKQIRFVGFILLKRKARIQSH